MVAPNNMTESTTNATSDCKDRTPVANGDKGQGHEGSGSRVQPWKKILENVEAKEGAIAENDFFTCSHGF